MNLTRVFCLSLLTLLTACSVASHPLTTSADPERADPIKMNHAQLMDSTSNGQR
ncbi:hypothetical protein [Hymenobacter sp. GOD-10R]|uniref:hypothetical protein n=1 Tax=Hymenobacter sp. GOD-10R TaxID=3093922 RepID=UPI002D797E44|nr:hypothetical protein [Hymenobacter sp. GOD-10R]WRQ27175.1 hypothetical protein SD425_19060 [Hymenobacter sp. GOD-10R]